MPWFSPFFKNAPWFCRFLPWFSYSPRYILKATRQGQHWVWAWIVPRCMPHGHCVLTLSRKSSALVRLSARLSVPSDIRYDTRFYFYVIWKEMLFSKRLARGSTEGVGVNRTSLHAARPLCPDTVEKVQRVGPRRWIVQADMAPRGHRQHRQYTDHHWPPHRVDRCYCICQSINHIYIYYINFLFSPVTVSFYFIFMARLRFVNCCTNKRI